MIVFDFNDHHQFILAWFAEKPVRTQGVLARRIGCCKAVISYVVTGRKRLTVAKAEDWARGLGLEGQQAEYFIALVHEANGETAFIRRAGEREATRIRELHREQQARRFRERLQERASTLGG